jgi:hypothetical protein
VSENWMERSSSAQGCSSHRDCPVARNDGPAETEQVDLNPSL